MQDPHNIFVDAPPQEERSWLRGRNRVDTWESSDDLQCSSRCVLGVGVGGGVGVGRWCLGG